MTLSQNVPETIVLGQKGPKLVHFQSKVFPQLISRSTATSLYISHPGEGSLSFDEMYWEEKMKSPTMEDGRFKKNTSLLRQNHVTNIYIWKNQILCILMRVQCSKMYQIHK